LPRRVVSTFESIRRRRSFGREGDLETKFSGKALGLVVEHHKEHLTGTDSADVVDDFLVAEEVSVDGFERFEVPRSGV
jgi:hypothetical protein